MARRPLKQVAMWAYALLLLGSLAIPLRGAADDAAEGREAPPYSVATLESKLTFESIGLVFDPVAPAEYVYAISAEEAAKIAWGDGVPGTPGRAVVSPALLSTDVFGSYSRTPVWLIRYEGACVPNFGPAGNEAGGCLGDSWNVVVEDKTGLVVSRFSEGG